MKTLLKTRKNEVGATAIEYGLIAAFISVAIIAVVQNVGGHLQTVFGAVSSGLSSAASAGSSAG